MKRTVFLIVFVASAVVFPLLSFAQDIKEMPLNWRHKDGETVFQSGDSSELASRLPCKGKSVRNRGVSQTMPFLVIPRSLLRGGFILPPSPAHAIAPTPEGA
jgi:hypothetical protein